MGKRRESDRRKYNTGYKRISDRQNIRKKYILKINLKGQRI